MCVSLCKLNLKTIMKKTVLSILALSAILCVESKAQNPFFDKVTYSGALGSDANQDWTKKWTNWNPNAQAYPAATDSLTLTKNADDVVRITSDLTLDANTVYLMRSVVSVEPGAKLTIPAGTIIRAQATTRNSEYAAIVVKPGGKIDVQGTADKPVIMTSNKPLGARKQGDWGGLVLLGKATNNQVGGKFKLEGFNKVTVYEAGAGAESGGTDDADNSGSVKYLRIEFPGYALDVNKEINGLTLASVGNGTVLDNIQVSYSGDDSFEWFGGTVNAKHLIAFGSSDDDFDTDFGFRGMVQYGIGYKVPGVYDLTWNVSGGSTGEGFESDNDASGTVNLPQTAAVFANMTMVGAFKPGFSYKKPSAVVADSNTVRGAYRRGARIRRNSAQSIINSVFLGYRNFLMIDGPASIGNAGVGATPDHTKALRFRGNVLAGVDSSFKMTIVATPSTTANGLVEVAAAGPLSDLDAWVKNSGGMNFIRPSYAKAEILEELNDMSALNFRPVAQSIALTSAVTDSKVPVGLDETVFVGGSFAVYPNPATSSVAVEFELTQNASVAVEIYNVLGAKVATLANAEFAAGNNTVNANLSLEPGIYVVKVSNGTSTSAARLVIK